MLRNVLKTYKTYLASSIFFLVDLLHDDSIGEHADEANCEKEKWIDVEKMHAHTRSRKIKQNKMKRIETKRRRNGNKSIQSINDIYEMENANE